MVLLRPNPAKCDSKFLLYAIQSPKVQNEIKASEGTGSTVSNLRIPLINSLLITCPSLKEQQAIAGVLGALDDKIELNRRMNETLEAMARAIFKSWFVDFDPVRAKAEGRQPAGMDAETAALFPKDFYEINQLLIPDGWQLMQISELCLIGRGASPRPINDYMNGEVPWIKIADATSADGPYIFETREKVTKLGAEKSVAVVPGDLILSNSATCGIPIFVELSGCIHDGWIYFRQLQGVTKIYLYHAFLELTDHLVLIADGSVQKNLTER
jgi:type I restriction enzyme S subunit